MARAYRIDGIRIVKTGAKQPTPFFSSDYIECAIEWRSLFKGSLVAAAVFGRPQLNLVQAAKPKADIRSAERPTAAKG